ncbi:MAG: Spy/CpxP family protein refolding chaperone [Gammaproteobacteria bacterium]|nr:Spy/CpxP family protein refolding chaperone [Gammaproteobacteria bacterium]
MKAKTILAGIVVTAAMATSVIAYSHYNMTPEEHVARVAEKLADKLELTQSQKYYLTVVETQILETHRESGQAASHSELVNSLLKQSGFDRQQGQELFDRHLRTFQSRGPAVINAFADFYDALSPEQRDTLKSCATDKHHHFLH